jgi:hypothetical protein
LLASAMGVQNATARRLAVPDLTTTVLTMTLTGIAADVRHSPLPTTTRRVLAVLTMLLGAFAGALLILNAGLAWALALASSCSASWSSSRPFRAARLPLGRSKALDAPSHLTSVREAPSHVQHADRRTPASAGRRCRSASGRALRVIRDGPRACHEPVSQTGSRIQKRVPPPLRGSKPIDP